MHELLHAIFNEASGDHLLDMTGDQEEKTVRLLAPWLLNMIRDNPALIEFLTA